MRLGKNRVPLLDLRNVWVLIRILHLDIFEEVFKLHNLAHLFINSFMLSFQSFEFLLCIPNFLIFSDDFDALGFGRFQVFRLSCVLLAQEGAKPDQVILDEDILLSQLFLTDTAAFLFPKSKNHLVISSCIDWKQTVTAQHQPNFRKV